jgi:hypothetical protein
MHKQCGDCGRSKIYPAYGSGRILDQNYLLGELKPTILYR